MKHFHALFAIHIVHLKWGCDADGTCFPGFLIFWSKEFSQLNLVVQISFMKNQKQGKFWGRGWRNDLSRWKTSAGTQAITIGYVTLDCLLPLCKFPRLYNQETDLNHGLCLLMGFHDPTKPFGVCMWVYIFLGRGSIISMMLARIWDTKHINCVCAKIWGTLWTLEME